MQNMGSAFVPPTATRSEPWDRCADILVKRFDAPAVAVWDHDFLTDQGRIRHGIGLAARWLGDYAARFARSNIWLHVGYRYRPGEALTGNEIVSNRDMIRSEFYREWLQPQDFFHCLLGVLGLADRQIRCVALFRSLAAPPFGADEKRDLADFLPFLQSTGELEDGLAGLQRHQDVLLDVLARLPGAVMVVDHDGHPILLNQAAASLLARSEGLAMRNGVLVAGDYRETRELQRLIARATEMPSAGLPAEGMMVLRHVANDRPVFMTVSPLTHALPNGKEAAAPVAALFTRAPTGTADHSRLCELFRLTPAEARLAGLIANGRSLMAAATELHVSKNTVRTHMKRIYAKTETHRQVDLVRLIAPWLEPKA
jgi:DNA-binding CsgD family transcriptional regulator/PAS domain-containing protein